MNSYINAHRKKQWTLGIIASSWIFLSSMDYVCLLSWAISLSTYTTICSKQALCLRSFHNMWIMLWLWKFVVYVILQCVIFVRLYNNPCAICIGEINMCFIIRICCNRYKKVLQTICCFVSYTVLYHNVEVLLELKKSVTIDILVTLCKCYDR